MFSFLRKSLLPCLALSVCVVCLAPARCAAWGDTAHHVIARIAYARLTPTARARVGALLRGKGDAVENFVAASTYADDIRPLRRETASWHFVDIPADASLYLAIRDCRNDDCLVAVVNNMQRDLRTYAKYGATKGASPEESLKFLIHFVGDITQPFHCYDNNDRGGNTVRVAFRGNLTNLHAVWDTAMTESRMSMVSGPYKQEASYAERLMTGKGGQLHNLAEFDAIRWSMGTPEDWATESHQIALKAADLTVTANATPSNAPLVKRRPKKIAFMFSDETTLAFARPVTLRGLTTPELSGKYYDTYSVIMEEQLVKAGVRLARVLNEIFDR